MQNCVSRRIVPVILCGGTGKRLWPASRSNKSKQDLKLYNNKTLLQNTLARVKDKNIFTDPVIICLHSKRFMVQKQAEEIGVGNYHIITEPLGMNTSHAILSAAIYASSLESDSLICILPVDHFFKSNEKFQQTISDARQYMNKHIFVFGIPPVAPNSDFGYILPDYNSSCPSLVKSFKEKPNVATAQKLIDEGALWNSGIYMGASKIFIEEYQKYQPKTFKYVSQSFNEAETHQPFICLGDSYKHGTKEPIDRAISEKSDQLAMLKLSSNWSEIGNWLQLYELYEKNQAKTVINGNVVDINSENSFIKSDSSLLVTIGLKDCLVVQEKDATLVSSFKEIDRLPGVLQKMKEQHRQEVENHRYSHRPWGYFESIDSDSYYQVKKLIIHPKKSISYQKHHHRSEHWVVLKGVADIRLGCENKIVHAGESVFVPVGIKHQITNNQEKSLEIIEVQIGDYLREDDIIRYDDMFNRGQEET